MRLKDIGISLRDEKKVLRNGMILLVFAAVLVLVLMRFDQVWGAVLTVVGQCLGAGEKEQAVWYARRLLLVAYCGAWVMNLSAFLFANRFAISLFNLSPEAQTMALQVMVWFNFVSLFFWPSSFTLPNILRAAGDARFTMAVSILSMWVFRVGFCYVMVLGFHGRLLSIWMGMFLDWVFRSLCFFVRFARGRWMEQSVI